MLPAIKITKFQFVIFALQKKRKSESWRPRTASLMQSSTTLWKNNKGPNRDSKWSQSEWPESIWSVCFIQRMLHIKTSKSNNSINNIK
jgi:hypothetical protein